MYADNTFVAISLVGDIASSIQLMVEKVEKPLPKHEWRPNKLSAVDKFAMCPHHVVVRVIILSGYHCLVHDD